jgi:hypothetical protein
MSLSILNNGTIQYLNLSVLLNISRPTSPVAQSLDPSLELLFYWVYTIGYAYVYTVICGIGCVLNAICILLYAQRRYKGTMYSHLLNKTVFELLTLLISTLSPFSNCSDCRSLGARIYRLYFMRIIINMTFTCSGFAEIGLTYDRLMLFKSGANKTLLKVNFKHFFIISFVASVVLFVPNFFASQLVEGPNPGVYNIISTAFGISSAFNSYSIFIFVIQNLLTALVLIVLNYMVFIEYGNYFRKKTKLLGVSKSHNEQRLTSVTWTKQKADTTIPQAQTASVGIENNSKASVRNLRGNNAKIANKNSTDADRNFTLMIMISSSLFTISRILEGTTSIVTHVDKANGIVNNPWLAILGWFAHLATYLSFSSNIIFSFIFNKLFRGHLIESLCKIKLLRLK